MNPISKSDSEPVRKIFNPNGAFKPFSPRLDRIVIAGSGLVGACLAREFALRGYEVDVLDKDTRPNGQSVRNSNVLHSGVNQKNGTAKAFLVTRGNRVWLDYCAEKGLPIVHRGTLVVELPGDDPNYLNLLMDYGQKNGVRDLKMLSESQIKDYEPYAEGKRGLISLDGAIVHYGMMLMSIIDDAQNAGAVFHWGEGVTGLSKDAILTNKIEYSGCRLINAAGLYADRIAHMDSIALDLSIIPFRGAYKMVHGAEVNSMIYHVPKIKHLPFLGIHMTATVDGKVLAGPTAMPALFKEQYDGVIKGINNTQHFLEMLEIYFSQPHFWNILSPKAEKGASNARVESLKNIGRTFRGRVPHEVFDAMFDFAFINAMHHVYCGPATGLSNHPAGNRAQVVKSNGELVNDMVVLPGHDGKYVHILNWVSPGATCSLFGAEQLVRELELK